MNEGPAVPPEPIERLHVRLGTSQIKYIEGWKMSDVQRKRRFVSPEMSTVIQYVLLGGYKHEMNDRMRGRLYNWQMCLIDHEANPTYCDRLPQPVIKAINAMETSADDIKVLYWLVFMLHRNLVNFPKRFNQLCRAYWYPRDLIAFEKVPNEVRPFLMFIEPELHKLHASKPHCRQTHNNLPHSHANLVNLQDNERERNSTNCQA